MCTIIKKESKRLDADRYVDAWKQRLVAMAENPPYVFRDTPQDLIEQHRAFLTTFAGYPEADVASMEARLGVRLPAVFRTYLLKMGIGHAELFQGSDLVSPASVEQFRADGIAIMKDSRGEDFLANEAVVFIVHQGYMFFYLLADGQFDGSVFLYPGGRALPRQASDTFAAFVDTEIDVMEETRAASRELGGYYLTLHRDGGRSEDHPALASGERPMQRTETRSKKPSPVLVRDD